ncbi:MAG: crossover junction endodeoxyribonuclease RuvC [Thermotoga sp.]|nr:MAG: crossover junction endodeoxyribonuclease RuvC [Thermotoga sp.]
MKIMGIDPGFGRIGYGVIEVMRNKMEVVDYGLIETPASSDIPTRLDMLYDSIKRCIKKIKPSEVAVETIYLTKNQKTAVGVSQARGVILLAIHQCHIPIFDYTPLQVKIAVTGYGKATKEQVQQMVQRLLNLPIIPKPDDVSDALAIAICHSSSRRSYQQ